ncbi:MAG: hypothetical protein ACREIA_00275 [Opitutaceae bacterium]
MAYSLQTSVKEDRIHFLATGKNAPAALAALFDECLAICRKTGQRVALLEDALTGPDIELNVLFEVIGHAADAARDQVDLVCYVKTTPGHDPGTVRFAENVASNHKVNVRVFRTVEDAERFIAIGRKWPQ